MDDQQRDKPSIENALHPQAAVVIVAWHFNVYEIMCAQYSASVGPGYSPIKVFDEATAYVLRKIRSMKQFDADALVVLHAGLQKLRAEQFPDAKVRRIGPDPTTPEGGNGDGTPGVDG